MPFQEKSAWIMSIALLLSSAIYVAGVASMSSAAGSLVPPILPLVVVFTIVLAVIAAIGHIAIAVSSPKEAQGRLDERERMIFDRAGHVSGVVFGAGVVTALGWYLFSYDGDMLFHAVFGSLVASQLAEYVHQIFLFRRAA